MSLLLAASADREGLEQAIEQVLQGRPAEAGIEFQAWIRHLVELREMLGAGLIETRDLEADELEGLQLLHRALEAREGKPVCPRCGGKSEGKLACSNCGASMKDSPQSSQRTQR